jgi:DNA-binding ferritin-like protein (Dps family)
MNTYIEQFKKLKTEIERNKGNLRNAYKTIEANYINVQPTTRILTFNIYPEILYLTTHNNTPIATLAIPTYLQPFLEQAIANKILTLLSDAETLADEERKRLARNAAQEYAELLCESNE